MEELLNCPLAKLDIKQPPKKYAFCVLGGEIAVPCNSQSATARLNSCRRMLIFFQMPESGVESQARRNYEL